jgi:CMP-N,N'-diacetyllegionaminic acid synthase
MNHRPRIIAIITARGGSKRLKNKNIRLLQGKPLIAYSITAALKTRQIDRVVVSTDSPVIARIARHYGAEVPFIRPARLAQDTTQVLDVLRHTLLEIKKKEGQTYDAVVLLQPTSPLRTHRHITEAIDLFFRKRAATVIGVCPMDHSPYWAVTVDAGGRLHPLLRKKRPFVMRGQDLPVVYRLNGAVYVYRSSVILEKQEVLSRRTYAYIMDRVISYDIDDALDLAVVKLLKEKGRHFSE